jgi:hypothetical protein
LDPPLPETKKKKESELASGNGLIESKISLIIFDGRDYPKYHKNERPLWKNWEISPKKWKKFFFWWKSL